MKQFMYGDSQVSYVKEGKGSVVMLIHGFAEDHDVWRHQVPFLSRYFTVIAPDLPGSGTSHRLQPPGEQEEVTINHYAECLCALLQHEGVGRCVLLGHSMGGYITLAMAENCPGIVAGFGLVHSTAFADSEEKKKVREKGIGTLQAYGSYQFIKTTTPNLFSKTYKATHGADIGSLIERGRSFSVEALQQYYKAMMLRSDKTQVLKNSKVPVLFIIGKEDSAAPLTDLLQQVHLPQESHIYILNHTAHMGMWEKPDEVNRFILLFVNSVAADPRLPADA